MRLTRFISMTPIMQRLSRQADKGRDLIEQYKAAEVEARLYAEAL